MEENKFEQLVQKASLGELVDFFDTHDMGEHWEQMSEASFDIDIKRRTHLIAVDEALLSKITPIADAQRVSVETLIHSWLQEKALEAGNASRS